MFKALITPIKVGIFALLSVLSLTWISKEVSEEVPEDASVLNYYALFDDASGLTEKTKVVIAGIRIGQITKIELAGQKAKVWIKSTMVLKDDTQVAKKQASLLGESYLQIIPGYQGNDLANQGQITRIFSDVSTADIMAEVQSVMKNVKDITESLKHVLAGENGEQRLVGILENINKIVLELNKTVSTISPKIDRVVSNTIDITNDAKGLTKGFKQKADAILANADIISQDAKAITKSVRNVIEEQSASTPESFKTALNTLKGSISRLDSTLEHTRSIAEKIDSGKGSVGQLINNDRLVNSISDFVDDTSKFVQRITRLQFVVAMRSEYYLQQAVSKNYFELKIQPRKDKYYLMQLVDAPGGKLTITDKSFAINDNGEKRQLSQTEKKTEDRFLITLQFAKRFDFITFRGGILESYGALGVDLDFFDDKLNLYTDLFQFQADRNPRLRMRACYEFFQHLYIVAGIDDVLNAGHVDSFVGAGIRFTDNDLQGILATAPVPAF
jgi:phospholipid/cholesterol/gamma-HCH transport system substrate-binding protein